MGSNENKPKAMMLLTASAWMGGASCVWVFGCTRNIYQELCTNPGTLLKFVSVPGLVHGSSYTLLGKVHSIHYENHRQLVKYPSITFRVQSSARHTSLTRMAINLKLSWRMFLFVTFSIGPIFGSTQELTSGLELSSGELESNLPTSVFLFSLYFIIRIIDKKYRGIISQFERFIQYANLN